MSNLARRFRTAAAFPHAMPLHLPFLAMSIPNHSQPRLFSTRSRFKSSESSNLSNHSTKPSPNAKRVPSSAARHAGGDHSTCAPEPLSHLTSSGSAHMISIAHKTPTFRSATATSTILFSRPHTLISLKSAKNKKGDALAVARIAAIQATKQTANLIPLAHPSLSITGIEVDITPFDGAERLVRESIYAETADGTKNISDVSAQHGGVTVRSTVDCEGKTGVEMEALTSAMVGTLTLYDMLKGVDKGMVIMGSRVVRKVGGKSGGWYWDEQEQRLVREREDQHVRKPKQEVESGTVLGGPLSPSTQASTSTSSEIDEWNQGLAEEFAIGDDSGEYGIWSENGPIERRNFRDPAVDEQSQ